LPKNTKTVDFNLFLEDTYTENGGPMMQDSLTTEALRKKFKNNFDLCNFSIQVGRNMILGGTQSTLAQILEEVDRKADE
jgi:hypothetical protein